MVVLIIFPVILQTVINLIMLSIGGQGQPVQEAATATFQNFLLLTKVSPYHNTVHTCPLSAGDFDS